MLYRNYYYYYWLFFATSCLKQCTMCVAEALAQKIYITLIHALNFIRIQRNDWRYSVDCAFHEITNLLYD